MERKGLRMNGGKTEGIQLLFGMKSSLSKADPCGVYGGLAGSNSIQCIKCQKWVHRFIIVVLMCLGR